MLTTLRRYTVSFSIDYLQRGLLLGGIGLAMIFVLVNLVLSWPWMNQPFAGFLHRNRAVVEAHVPGWSARETDLTVGEVVLAVDGQALSPSAWLDYLRQQQVGQAITYSVLTDAGQVAELTIAVSLFTARDFTQLVLTPIFMALIALITAGMVAYYRSRLLTVKLFSLFTLAMVFFVASLPDFIMGATFPFNFVTAAVGGILMPPLLLHFLLIFPYPRNVLKSWPFLLPLIYVPVLPALIHLSILVVQPETIRTFDRVIYFYMAVYAVIGLGLLLEASIRTDDPLVRKQTLVLLIGFTVPTILFILNAVLVDPIDFIPIHQILERYAFIGIPIAVVFAIARYNMFGIKRPRRWQTSYLQVIGVVILGYVLLVLLINPVRIDLSWIEPGDLILIVYTVAGFFVLRPLIKSGRRWVEQAVWGSVEDFRIGLRIFSHELLKVKNRHELEALVSWDIPADFRLRSAELASSNRPSSPYALRLPLSVSNYSLGTLFFGAKINRKSFTKQEMAVFSELQQQVSLALWSLELDEAIHRIEELTRLKSKFLANVTHELRTPLNGIINYIGFVLDGDVGPLNPEQTGHLNRALQGTEKLLEIINNILDMSKIEAGQMVLQLRPVNLADLVTELIPAIEEMIGEKPVTMVTDVAPNLPLVQGDQLRLRQVIMNLFANAAKYTDKGMIRLSLYPDNGRVMIQMSDTGQGIDETILPTIFQQFTSTSLTDIGRVSGPGLGMPITKSLVELHGGQLFVESRVKQGATFTISLPVHLPMAELEIQEMMY
jgi:signal transduction histidine kinase